MSRCSPQGSILCGARRARWAWLVFDGGDGQDGRVIDRSSLVLGRDRECQAVLDFVSGLEHAGGTMLLVGAAGIGKTTLWQVGVEEARRRSQLVLSARGYASDMGLALAGLSDLVEPVASRVLPLLVGPQRGALEAALGMREARAQPDPRVLGLAVRSLLVAVAAGGPVLLAIDDLQWLDRASVAPLDFALKRLGAASVGLLATVRGDSSALPFGFERALDREAVSVEVGPLSLGAVRGLLRERLSVSLPRPLMRRIYDRSGGNPFYALELGRALVELGTERLPESLQAVVSGRIARLPKRTRELLVLLACAPEPTLGLVRALDFEDSLGPAERAGIVVVDGQMVRFSHPLLLAGVHDGAASAQRRSAHSRLAVLSDGLEERARHLALAADGPSEPVAETLEAAAAAALRRGAPTVATELAEQALELTPADAARSIHRRRLQAARGNQTVGDTTRQRELLELALSAASAPSDRAEPLWQLASFVMSSGDMPRARAMVDEALGCADDDALSAEILITTSWLDDGFFGSVEHAQAALALAERVRDPMLLSRVLGRLAVASFSRGLGFRRDLFERAVALERACDFIDVGSSPTVSFGWAAKWAGDIPLARELLERCVEAANEDDASGSHALFYLAWLHIIAGEWPRALERAEAAFEIDRDVDEIGADMALMTSAVVEAYQGRLDNAEQHLDETRDRNEGPGRPLWAHAMGLVALARAEPETAAATLGPAIAGMRATGIDEPGLYPWLPTYLDALLLLDRLDEAAEWIDWLETHARRLERRWGLAIAAHYRGALAAAGGELDVAAGLLAHALELHEGLGRPFDRACTLLTYGQVLRRARRKAAARAALQAAQSEFEALGAQGWVHRAGGELQRIGGRARGANQLTPTESRIAELVSAGRSNKEVAAGLFVTVRTVETTLTRIYAKLGVRSRSELAALRATEGDQA